MKIFQTTVLFTILLSVPLFSFTQQLKQDEIVDISGEKFILHQVRTGETVFSISKKFKVDRGALIQNNPKIKRSLDIGDVLKIPLNEGADLTSGPVHKKGDPTGFNSHVIKSRSETPYFIAKNYGITVEELYAYNPEVRKFKKGTKVRIPVWEKQEEETAGTEVATVAQTEGQATAEGTGSPVPGSKTDDNLIAHTVEPGETLYSISKKYNVTEGDILFYNPPAQNLKSGSKIYLPKAVVGKKEVPIPSDDNGSGGVANYFEHIIESGETLWGVSRKYDVSEGELLTLNPFIENGFPAGAVLKVPVTATGATAEPVNNNAFTKHIVGRGETLYGLSAKYGIKIPDLKKYNPVLETRNLLPGETVLVPKTTGATITDSISGQTAGVETVPEAGVETGIEGMEQPDYYDVKVPSEGAVAVPVACRPQQTAWNSFETYRVALFLPFFEEANDTLNKTVVFHEADSLPYGTGNLQEIPPVAGLGDSLEVEEATEDMFVGFYRGSENFIQFYEGVLLAMDSMRQVGMNIELKVFDTQQNIDAVREAIFSYDFLQTDLIIGPVYPEVQTDVAAIAAKNRIPMVSPLSAQSDKTRQNPYLFQVNPDRDYIAAQTAKLVAEEYFNSNFIVFKTSNYEGTPEGKLVEMIQEKLYNSGFMGKPAGVGFSVYDYEHDGFFGLRRILSHDKENVIFIPSSVEGELSIGISNINNLADEYPITLIGTSRFPQYESIQIGHFHNLKLEYISPYWADYNKPSTINFMQKFKSCFYTEPNNFGMQGYDVAFYFLNALKNYGKDFSDCLPYLQVDLVQGNYQFEKVSQFGGYVNQGVSVISYQRGFDVVRKRVEGQLNLVTN